VTDISVIILTGKEELHIKRCLEKLAPLEPKQVFIVESQKGDRTHEVAIEVARHLQWQVKVKGEGEEGGNSTLQLQLPTATALHLDRRAMAEKKVAEWLTDVDDETFEAALQKLVEEKTAAGEYRFKRPEDRRLALEGARRFYREFSRKIIPLSDGRYVYFAPDQRSRARNAGNAISWAEYAFHAVSSSGKLLDGKNFRERIYNATKVADLPVLESVIRSERCMYRLIDAYPENDAVIFVGHDAGGGRLEVVARLDQFGNAEANLGEVTVIAKHKRKENPPPKFRPLTEVVEAVAKHQAAGFSPSTTEDSVANPPLPRKWGGEVVSGQRLVVSNEGEKSLVVSGQSLAGAARQESSVVDGGLTTNNSQLTTLHLVWHDWPGNQAAQFNWFVDNHRIETEWILRLDADEYLLPETIEEIRHLLPTLSKDVTSLSLSLARRWFGKEIRYGSPKLWLTRMFRTGYGRYPEGAEMDEHLLVESGRELRLSGEFVDDSIMPFAEWKAKHYNYARREAAAYLRRRKATENRKGKVNEGRSEERVVGGGLATGRRKKELYDKLPLFVRPFIYWGLRYILMKGFLDGRAGWSWNWWQGLWYRWQVDREISRLRREE